MTDLYIPQIKDCIRLTSPLIFNRGETNNQYGYPVNSSAIARINYPGVPYGDQTPIDDNTVVTLEEGTVLQFRRYHVSVQAKTNDVEVSIFASPRRDLTMKKNGGTGQMVKLVLPIEVMNRIQYERVIL